VRTKAWMFLIPLLLIGRTAICDDWDYLDDGLGKLPECSSISERCDGELKTRYGTLQMAFQDDYEFTVSLDGKSVGTFAGEEFAIRNVYSIGANDVLLLALYSGGTACPFDVYILQINSDSTFKLSESFGNCSPRYKAYVDHEVLIIKMPPYFNPEHYRDLSPEEQKEIDAWKESVFKWSNSSLTSQYGDTRHHKKRKSGGQR